MVLRVTQKLAKKLKIESLSRDEIKCSAFEEWYAHLFVAMRQQWILVTNAYSLYSFILPARGIKNVRSLADAFNINLALVMIVDGLEEQLPRFCLKPDETVEVAATESKKVLSSMNDMINNAKYNLNYNGYDPVAVASFLNEMPMGMLKYGMPYKVLKNMALS